MGTPYEVRENLVARAYDYLVNKYHANVDQARSLDDKKMLQDLTFPTTDEILALAEIYKNFIEKK